MAEPPPRLRAIDRLASLPGVLGWALGLRVVAVGVVEWYVRRQQKGWLCVFPDTQIYWLLAGAIRDGKPYVVWQQGGIPHFALRTPGYPVFLAACRAAFGDRPLGVRLVQAVLGAVSVWLVYRLSAAVVPGRTAGRAWSIPLLAAALAAFDPYFVATSALILSEAVFVPLMLASLWGLAVLWRPEAKGAPGRGGLWTPLATGAASGAAILVRPSWALFVPAMALAWVVAGGRPRWAARLRGAVLVGAGVVLVMAPWWVRNARIYGRLVPTAIWTGASLYDGLSPRATGASDMDEFMTASDIWPLDEETQDRVLRARALAFARAHPGRVLRLALVKLGRYWSPWPNAEGFRSRVVALASAAVTLPVFGLLAVGLWKHRRDARALVLLAGPLFYFCVLHMIFASSMRYRIPAAVPALALAAVGSIGSSAHLKRRRRRDPPLTRGSSREGGRGCASVSA